MLYLRVLTRYEFDSEISVVWKYSTKILHASSQGTQRSPGYAYVCGAQSRLTVRGSCVAIVETGNKYDNLYSS